MNKALVLLEALQAISLEILDDKWDGDEETLVQNILTIADDTVNMVGGREEIDFLYEDLRCKTIDLDVATDRIQTYELAQHILVKNLIKAITPVLTAVDDLTDLGVSSA